uniref:Gem-associated protein 2 n=1 Tax=Dendroctonus ponderosae TaxID=77166 RepID=A0AAR5QHK4_DENPD
MATSESSDDECGVMRKALDVSLPDDFDPESIPQTGEEYLHHVIYERTNKCRKWVTAEGDFTKYKKNQTVHVTIETESPKALEKFCPSKSWQDNALQDYIQLRTFLSNTQQPNPTDQSICKKSFWKSIEKTRPSFSEITQYSQAAKILMLAEITKYLENVRIVSETVGVWIYAILALLEKPLSPDCCYKLRQFAKKCIELRAALKEEDEVSLANPLNLFICVIARFFNQLDLAD